MPNTDDIRLPQGTVAARHFQANLAAARDIVRAFDWDALQADLNRLRSLQPAIEQAARQCQVLETDAHRKAVPILRRRGWFGVAPYLDVVDVLNCSKVFQKKGPLAFDRFVCSRFSRSRHRLLRQVTKDWWTIPYLKRRRPLVRAALAAYKRGQHSLAVAALLPLVEGLAAAYFRKHPALVVPSKGKQPTIRVGAAAGRHREVRADHADLLEPALTKQIYARYEFGTDRAPSALNRHGILHGEIVDFGTEKNSLRTILLLDVMCRVALAGPRVP